MTWPEGERIAGIEMPLPPGESVRWQGGPEWRSLARHAFHVRKIAVYFGVLLVWRAALAAGEPAPWAFFLAGAVPLVLLGSVAIVTSLGLAWLIARSARYAITDRRVVMRVGLVVNSVINIPFRQVDSAAVKRYRDGSGDLAVRLGGPDRIAYLHLWPHARGWRLRQPEPAFRSIVDPERVAEVLRTAVASIGAPGVATAPGRAEPRAADPASRPVRGLVQTT